MFKRGSRQQIIIFGSHIFEKVSKIEGTVTNKQGFEFSKELTSK